MSIFTATDVQNKIQTLTASLPKLPTGYDSWEGVQDRIEEIHTNYSEDLASELEGLEDSYYSAGDILRNIEKLETELARVDAEPLELANLKFTYTDGEELTVFSWEDFIKEVNRLWSTKDYRSFCEVDIYYKCGAQAGSKGINCIADASEAMANAGYFSNI